MTDLPPYDSTFDLGGLPGDELPFTSASTTTAARSDAEPEPTAAVPPSDRATYQPGPQPTPRPTLGPQPTTSAQPAPVPPPTWPRQPEPAPRKSPSGATHSPTPPGSTRGTRGPGTSGTPGTWSHRSTSRRRRAGIWPLVALVVWGGGLLSSHDGGNDGGNDDSGSARVIPTDLRSYASQGDGSTSTMSWLAPSSVRDGERVTMVVPGAPHTSYTVRLDGDTVRQATSDDDFVYLIPVDQLDSTVVVEVSRDPSADQATSCQITGEGQPIAEGQGTGSLDCTYDPGILKE